MGLIAGGRALGRAIFALDIAASTYCNESAKYRSCHARLSSSLAGSGGAKLPLAKGIARTGSPLLQT